MRKAYITDRPISFADDTVVMEYKNNLQELVRVAMRMQADRIIIDLNKDNVLQSFCEDTTSKTRKENK